MHRHIQNYKAAQERTFMMKNPVSWLFVDAFHGFFTVAAQAQTKDVEKHSCQQLTVLTVQWKYNRLGN